MGKNKTKSSEMKKSSDVETKTKIFSPSKNVRIIQLTPSATKALTPKEINREPSKSELLKVEEMFHKKDYITEEETNCLVEWHRRHMINSKFYHLNFLLI